MSFLEKVQAAAMRSKITLLLDENLLELRTGLRGAGFKVITMDQGLSDDKIKEIAEGHAILTKNTKDFVNDAKAFDYDVISLELIKFIDPEPTKKNSTVQKIVHAVRDSGFYHLKGNFLLRLHADGTYKVDPIDI